MIFGYVSRNMAELDFNSETIVSWHLKYRIDRGLLRYQRDNGGEIKQVGKLRGSSRGIVCGYLAAAVNSTSIKPRCQRPAKKRSVSLTMRN